MPSASANRIGSSTEHMKETCTFKGKHQTAEIHKLNSLFIYLSIFNLFIVNKFISVTTRIAFRK